MKYKSEYFFCSKQSLEHRSEIPGIYSCINAVEWYEEFSIEVDGKLYHHQAAYNKAFDLEFIKLDWVSQPVLHRNPTLKGDFQKNKIFVEIQFGNSSTIFRDYYKFHYGWINGFIDLAVLIIPTKPKEFFPKRAAVSSVSNMASFHMAERYFKLLPIQVPILLIGLVPRN